MLFSFMNVETEKCTLLLCQVMSNMAETKALIIILSHFFFSVDSLLVRDFQIYKRLDKKILDNCRYKRKCNIQDTV